MLVVEMNAMCRGVIAFLFVFFSIAFSKQFSLTILHTNDIHGRFEETDPYGQLCSPRDSQVGKCYGGVARRAAMIKEIRSKEENVLLLDAGDVFTGTLWYDTYRGNATAKFMNDLQYDAMVCKTCFCFSTLRAEISHIKRSLLAGYCFSYMINNELGGMVG